MNMNNACHLIAASIFMLVYAATSNPLYQLVDAPLQKAAVDRLLDCLRATGVAYSISVESDGTIAISPTEHRSLNFKTTDRKLYECWMETVKSLKVVVDASAWSDSGEVETVDAASITYEYLQSKKAMGQASQPISKTTLAVLETIPKIRTIRNVKRAQEYYYFYQGERCESQNVSFPTERLHRGISQATIVDRPLHAQATEAVRGG